MKMLRISI